MNFAIEYLDQIVIFKLKCVNVDSDISARLKAELLIICQPDIQALVIDFTGVEYIDSSGLGALLLAHRQLRDHNIPIYLTAVQDSIMNLFEILNLQELFEYFPTLEEAIDAAQK
jgi:anti-sigma B factor antagonist